MDWPRVLCWPFSACALALALAAAGEEARERPREQPPAKAPDSKQDPPMICRNLTKGNVVASRLAIALTWEDRRRGLLGRTSLDPGEGMLIQPCWSVHTIGMKFAIDVVFVDRAMRVVGIQAEVKPGALNKSNRKAHSTLELPAGAAAARRLEVGDTLQVLRADEAEEKADPKADSKADKK